jgi:hypothetical protein
VPADMYRGADNGDAPSPQRYNRHRTLDNGEVSCRKSTEKIQAQGTTGDEFNELE